MPSAGNDHRLGANEAPPAIISMFLGDEPTEIHRRPSKTVRHIRGAGKRWKSAPFSPTFPRTPPTATAPLPLPLPATNLNSVPWAPPPISGPNIVLNTIVAESLRQFADELEPSQNFNVIFAKLIKRTIKAHKRIIFNGNNYSDEWVAEAESRGLQPQITVDALPFILPKNVELFTRHRLLPGGKSLPV